MHSCQAQASANAVGPLRRWVEQFCTDAGAPRECCADVALAASEAMTNVVMHAYRDRSRPGPMRVRAGTLDRRLLLEVEDDGVGLRPRVDSPGGGFGLALIASLAAELEFARGPAGTGTLVRMAFTLG